MTNSLQSLNYIRCVVVPLQCSLVKNIGNSRPLLWYLNEGRVVFALHMARDIHLRCISTIISVFKYRSV